MFNFIGVRRTKNRPDNSVDEAQLIKLVKNSVNMNEPDEMLSSRILRKVESKESHIIRKPLQIKSVAAIAALTLFVAVFSLQGNKTSDFSSKQQLTIISKAIAAVDNPDMVNYYKISIERISKAEGIYDRRPGIDAELWINSDASRVKFIKNDPQNKNTTVINGARISYAREINGKVEAEDRPLASKLNPIHIDPAIEVAKKYPSVLKDGDMRVSGEESIEGIDTYKLEPVSSKTGSVISSVNIRKDNYQPVKIVQEIVEPPLSDKIVWEKGGPENNEKPKRWTHITISNFKTSKLIDPGTLAKDFFSVNEVLESKDYQMMAAYSPKEAANFSLFDIYFLGESFGEYRIDNADEAVGYYHSLREPVYPEETVSLVAEQVGISYLKAAKSASGGPQVHISCSPTLSDQQIEWMTKATFDKTVKRIIQVAGREGLLIEGNISGLAPGYTSTQAVLYIDIGKVTVRIEAENKDIAIEAAKHIKKLN